MSKPVWMSVSVCVALLGASCVDRDRDAPAAAAAPAPAVAPAAPPPPSTPAPSVRDRIAQAQDKVAEAIAARGLGGANPTTPLDPATLPPGAMGTAMQAFGEAMQAAAAPQTGTPCEQAHASFGVMMQALATKMPGRNFPPPTPREEFLRACNALPEPMQRCLIIGHAMANAEQCRALKDQLDPETRARIQALITPGRGRAAAAPPSPTPTP